MQADKWDVGAVLDQAWAIFKENAAQFILATLAFMVLGGAFAGIDMLARSMIGTIAGFGDVHNSRDLVAVVLIYGVSFVLNVLYWVANVFLSLGFLRMVLEAVRGEAPEIQDLGSGLPYIVPGLLASLVTGVLTTIGLIFCVAPGLILAIGFIFTMLLVVDRNMGPIEAMKESWALTEGEKLDLLLWLLLSGVIVLVGLLACCVGLLVAVPVVAIGTGLIYQNVLERKTL